MLEVASKTIMKQYYKRRLLCGMNGDDKSQDRIDT